MKTPTRLPERLDGAMAAQYLQTLKQLSENPGTVLV